MQVNNAHSKRLLFFPLPSNNYCIFIQSKKIMMKKFNFIRDGATSKLPPGFRFQPTDQEIVFQYLARKVFSCPLPASVIPEFDVFAFHPSDLPGDAEMDRYFFASREVNSGNAGGFWKATGSDKRIALSSSRRSFPIVGMKRTLVFYQGKHPRAVRTDWFAHVYYISTSAEADRRRRRLAGTVQIGKWVLCHVFMKRRGLKEQSCEEMSSEGESSSCCSSSSSSSASDSSVVSEEVSSTAADV